MSRATKIRELRRWVLDLSVDHYSKGLLHVLIQYVDKAGWCWPAMSRIALESGMSINKARRVVQALQDRGLVHVERSIGRRANRYRLAANTPHRGGLSADEHPTGGAVNTPHCGGLRKRQPSTPCTPTPHGGETIGYSGQEEAYHGGNSAGVKHEAAR